jgi:hypothetical protein
MMRRLALGLLILAGLGLIPQGVRQVKPDAAAPQVEVPAPTMEQMLGIEPLLTSSLSDAHADMPFFDNFNPQQPALISLLPHTDDGGYRLARSGFFQQDFESFCLHAGAYGPGEGGGYVFAPIKGPMASVFRNVMARSAKHPEIPQGEVQSLLWNMLGSLNSQSFKHSAAGKLLAPDELAALDRLCQERTKRSQEWTAKWSQEWIANSQKRQKELKESDLAKKKAESDKRLKEMAKRMEELQAKGDLQALMREVQSMQVDLQESIRMQTLWTQALMNPNISLAEMERAFMREGEPKPGPGSRNIPRGRWAFHPDGFFIRYFPSGFKKTKIQLYVPRPFEIKKDRRGRIASLSDGSGRKLEFAYDDSIPPVMVAEDPSVKGYAFRTIRLVHRSAFGPETTVSREYVWTDKCWYLSGIPSGKGRPAQGRGRFQGLSQSYAAAAQFPAQLRAFKQELDKFREETVRPVSRSRASAEIARAGLNDAAELLSLANGTKDIFNLPPVDERKERRTQRAKEELKKMFGIDWEGAGADGSGEQYAAEMIQEGAAYCLAASCGGWIPEGSFLGGPGGGLSGAPSAGGVPSAGQSGGQGQGQGQQSAPKFNPSDGVAVPGNTARQRIGVGKPQPKSDKANDKNAVQYELEVAKLIKGVFQDLVPNDGESIDDYLKRVNDEITKRIDSDLKKTLSEKNIRGTPEKPKAPMGTDPGDLRIAPGGGRDDPAYKTDWENYDKMSPQDFENYIRDKYFGNDPDPVWKSYREHEQDHIDLGKEQQARAKEAGSPNWKNAFKEWTTNPFLRRQAELRAYDRQIKSLENWLANDP